MLVETENYVETTSIKVKRVQKVFNYKKYCEIYKNKYININS